MARKFWLKDKTNLTFFDISDNNQICFVFVCFKIQIAPELIPLGATK